MVIFIKWIILIKHYQLEIREFIHIFYRLLLEMQIDWLINLINYYTEKILKIVFFF